MPPHFAVDEPLPILLAAIMGFQHAAAMVGGIIAATLVTTVLSPDKAVTQCELLACKKFCCDCATLATACPESTINMGCQALLPMTGSLSL